MDLRSRCSEDCPMGRRTMFWSGGCGASQGAAGRSQSPTASPMGLRLEKSKYGIDVMTTMYVLTFPLTKDNGGRDLDNPHSIPLSLKSVILCVLKRIASISTRTSAIIEKNAVLRKRFETFNDLEKKNKELKKRLRSFELKEVSHPPSSDPTSNKALPHEEIERRRSIVISGIPEIHDSNCFDRMHYDYQSVLNILSHLDVDCYPVAVYRLGKWIRGKNGSIKVILPCSMYQRIAAMRARRLSSFPESSVFLRASLTLKERLRRRESRLSRSRPVVLHQDVGAVHVPPPVIQSENCLTNCSTGKFQK
ncbi:hypothetical protein OSTOST_03746, partial [Ostertagia ostertagi]